MIKQIFKKCLIGLTGLILILSLCQVSLAARFEYPKFHADTTAGVPLVGGLLYTYTSGTTTAKATYSDKACTVANTNPIVLDSLGDAVVYGYGSYKLVLKTSAGATIWTVDNVWGGDETTSKYYFPDSSATDQGVTGSSNTLKYYIDLIGSNQGTICLTHDSTSGVTTTYTLTTSETVPAGISLKQEKGAIINGAGTLTYAGGPKSVVAQPNQQIFGSSLTVVWTLGGTVYPEWWGTTGNGTTDDQANYQRAATSCVSKDILLKDNPGATYKLGSQLSLRYINEFDLQGKYVIDFTGVGIIIGDSSITTSTGRKFINSVRNTAGTTPTDPLIRVIGFKNGDLTVEKCDYLQIYADGAVAADKSSAYNTFHFNYVGKQHLYSAEATGWINENIFHGGRADTIIVDGGGYGHNHNRWIGPCLEASTVEFHYGNSNCIENARFEGASTVTFDAGTWSNMVTQSFHSSYGTGSFTPTVTDNGVGNIYYREQFLGRNQRVFFNLNKHTRIYTNSCEIPNFSTAYVEPGVDKLTFNTNNAIIWTSDYIPVAKGQMFRIGCDQTIIRGRIYVYDSTKTAITTVPTGQITTAGGTWDTSYYKYSSDVANITAAISEVTTLAFIRFVLYSGSAGSGVPFDYIIGYNWPRFHTIDQKEDSWMTPRFRQVSLAASPTKGFASIGEMVPKTDGASIYICTKSYDYLTDEIVDIAEVAIDLVDATGVASGDIVGLVMDNGATHWTTVNGAPAGNTVTLTVGPTVACAKGNRIIFNLWATKTF